MLLLGFEPVLVLRPDDPHTVNLGSSSAVDQWAKAERTSLAEGTLRAVREAFQRLGAGVVVDWFGPGRATERKIFVPVPACYQVDHPQHMQMVKCTWCGFCNVGGGGKRALHNFEQAVECRTTASCRAKFEQLERAQRQQQQQSGSEGRQAKKPRHH